MFEAEFGGGEDSGSEKERGGEEVIETVVAAEGYRLWYGVECGAEKKVSGVGSWI